MFHLRHASFVTLFLLLVSAGALAVPDGGFAIHRVKVFSEDPAALRIELERGGFDVAGLDLPEGFVEVIASPRQLEQLSQEGLRTEVIESRTGGLTTAVPSGYRHFNTLVPLLFDLQDDYPSLAQVVDVGQLYGVGNTYQGRKIGRAHV